MMDRVIKSMIRDMQNQVRQIGRSIALGALLLISENSGGQTVPLPSPAPTPSQTTPAPQPPANLAALSSMADAPNWATLTSLSKTLTKEEFVTALETFYSDGSAFPTPWEVEEKAVVVKTGDPIAPSVRIEFLTPKEKPAEIQRYWRRPDELPPLNGRPPLSDMNVALDPGHIGGAYAKIEERFLSFAPGESIQEGDLSLLTAQLLKKRLETLGAVVTLVRENSEPVTSFRPADLRLVAQSILRDAGVPMPVENYNPASGEAKILTTQWQSEKLFYRVSEIRARAKKVNEKLKPDVVFCLHFNAESWGDATLPQFSPQNHMHILINGCFSPLELASQDVRFEMIGRIFSKAHATELPLAEAIAESLAGTTGLPPYVYTTANAKRVGTNSYVYARNLLANRLYQCPVIYLEPFVMNHQETYQRLLLGHFQGRTLVGGKLRSSAIEEYVEGVVRGLLKYSQNKRVN
jgi:N-acetylmuramoyl-L-alanine amidase